MENLAQEIFNILKGANYKLTLFTEAGQKTTDPEEATRFYASNKDLMVSLRLEEKRVTTVVQAGKNYDITDNMKVINAIKKITHNNLGEFTVRNFDKNIEPKDFSHQSVNESAFGKAYGSIKTSYVPFKDAKLIIKHTKGVDESKRGARSRNLHSLFIENAKGEKFNFPHRYMQGAKAMTRHVSMGGTPYDATGQEILSVCEEIADLTKFIKHTKREGLVNEDNNDIVEQVKSRVAEQKSLIKSLTTATGYNNFQIQEKEESEIDVDISEQFLYNTFTAEEMQRVVSRVNRIVSENRKKDSMEKELIQKLFGMISNKVDLGMDVDPNDPEHPNNEDQKKYSGPEGTTAKLSAMLSFIGKRTKNDELANVVSALADRVYDLDPKMKQAVAKFAVYAAMPQKAKSESTGSDLAEEAISDFRKKIS